jgi:hypothetical protein
LRVPASPKLKGNLGDVIAYGAAHGHIDLAISQLTENDGHIGLVCSVHKVDQPRVAVLCITDLLAHLLRDLAAQDAVLQCESP